MTRSTAPSVLNRPAPQDDAAPASVPLPLVPASRSSLVPAGSGALAYPLPGGGRYASTEARQAAALIVAAWFQLGLTPQTLWIKRSPKKSAYNVALGCDHVLLWCEYGADLINRAAQSPHEHCPITVVVASGVRAPSGSDQYFRLEAIEVRTAEELRGAEIRGLMSQLDPESRSRSEEVDLDLPRLISDFARQRAHSQALMQRASFLGVAGGALCVALGLASLLTNLSLWPMGGALEQGWTIATLIVVGAALMLGATGTLLNREFAPKHQSKDALVSSAAALAPLIEVALREPRARLAARLSHPSGASALGAGEQA